MHVLYCMYRYMYVHIHLYICVLCVSSLQKASNTAVWGGGVEHVCECVWVCVEYVCGCGCGWVCRACHVTPAAY